MVPRDHTHHNTSFSTNRNSQRVHIYLPIRNWTILAPTVQPLTVHLLDNCRLKTKWCSIDSFSVLSHSAACKNCLKLNFPRKWLHVFCTDLTRVYSNGLTVCHLCTLQEHQRIRIFAIYQTFLALKFVLWAMEIFTFSRIQPIWVKIWGKYIYRKI